MSTRVGLFTWESGLGGSLGLQHMHHAFQPSTFFQALKRFDSGKVRGLAGDTDWNNIIPWRVPRTANISEKTDPEPILLPGQKVLP
jgi:hypothetical protein